MATRLHERLAQVRLQPRPAAARDWRAAVADAAFRRRAHGVVLMLLSVVGVSTALLAGDLGYSPLLTGMVGVYGFYLLRR